VFSLWPPENRWAVTGGLLGEEEVDDYGSGFELALSVSLARRDSQSWLLEEVDCMDCDSFCVEEVA
jgi:hypothetical protein